jgi:hypothetical protein
MSDELTPERAREMLEHEERHKHEATALCVIDAWTRDRERLAVVTAQRDALVPLAEAQLAVGDLLDDCALCDTVKEACRLVEKHYNTTTPGDDRDASTALAAIRAERTTTTEGGKDHA